MSDEQDELEILLKEMEKIKHIIEKFWYYDQLDALRTSLCSPQNGITF